MPEGAPSHGGDIGKTISRLVRTKGYPQKQAIAIAYSEQEDAKKSTESGPISLIIFLQ